MIGVLLVAVAAAMHAPLWVRLGVAAVGVCLIVDPIVAVALAGAIVLGVAAMRIVRRSEDAAAAMADELLAIDLMALGVSGGLTFHQAVTFAGAAVGGPVSDRLERRIRHLLAGGTADTSGDDAIASVFAAAARSASSGAPLRPALDAVAESVRRERAAEERARLARLPVKLLFPLALLILPGFVLLAVAPAVISGLSRLAG